MTPRVPKGKKKNLGDPSDGLRSAIFEIVKQKETSILDLYYDAYCRYLSKIDAKKRDFDQLKVLCLPVKQRFSLILNRFLHTLANETEKYDLTESEQNEEYALRFVVPGREIAHNVVLTTQTLYNIVASAVLTGLSGTRYADSGEDIAHILNKLVYVTFEDLWITSVVGFRSQHSVIQKLLSKLMMTQEEERKRLWQEIHDDSLQGLAVILLKLEIIEKFLSENLQAAKKELDLTKTITKHTIQRTRDLGHGFNLFWVEKKGFVFSLKTFIELFKQEFGIPVLITTSSGVEKIRGFAGITLFRIIQEGLHNVGKHSKASCAKVNVAVRENKVDATIEDDGQGFDMRDIRKKNLALRNLGLVFMKERVKFLDGSVQIDSSKGCGTTVRVNIPLASFSKKTNLVDYPEIFDKKRQSDEPDWPVAQTVKKKGAERSKPTE
jgi:signal transduction histidine kinase